MTGAGSAPLGWRAASVFVIAVGTRPVVLLAILAIGQAVLPLLGLFAMQHLIDAVADGIRGARTADAATSAALLATAAAAGIALLGSLVQTMRCSPNGTAAGSPTTGPNASTRMRPQSN
jgi:hypothetical protein